MSASTPPRGLLIAAPRSGSGKTTLTLGLLRAFRQRGLRIRGTKCGPDYIDPAFHAAATGRTGLNLDSWAMPPALLRSLVNAAAENCDLSFAKVDGSFRWRPRRARPQRVLRRHCGRLRLAGASDARRQRPIAIGRGDRLGCASLDPRLQIAASS